MLERYKNLYNLMGDLTYVFQAILALWGLYCIVLVLRRLVLMGFRNETAQEEFLDTVEQDLNHKPPSEVAGQFQDDPKALPKLVSFGLLHRNLGPSALRKQLASRLYNDIYSDIERKIRWINNCIKMAPMLGLFGTVLGMMGAFGKLGSQENVEPAALASDISLALITTAIGLGTAMPFMLALAQCNERLTGFQDMMDSGLARFLEVCKPFFPASGATTGNSSPARQKQKV